MGPFSTVRSFTDPYTPIESFTYDALIAPAVRGLAEQLERDTLADLPARGRLLDVGCGGGHIAIALAERRPRLEIVGLDLSPQQIARARRRGARLAPRLSFVQGSALDLPFPDASFDAVTSVASIKHWPDPARGLRECARVLRPGGALVVAEVDRGCRQGDAYAFVRAWRIPRASVPLPFAAFRTVVAGRSLDLDDARALLAELPLTDARVERVPGAPALVLRGRRA